MSQAQARPKHTPSPWWTVVAWLMLFAWWMMPPYRAQVQDTPPGPFSWDWRLARPDAKVCGVRLYNMNEGGASIQRWELLGFESREAMPLPYARIREQTLNRAYRAVCSALRKAGDAAPQVEATARCDDDGRFVVLDQRERNVCERPPLRHQTRLVGRQGGEQP